VNTQLNQQTKAAKAPVAPAAVAVTAPRILVAEDDIEMRRLLSWQLRNAGYKVTECGDGYQLLDQLGNPVNKTESNDFDLIISDIRMPGVSGLDVLEGMYLSDWFTPMILITAFGDAEIHERAEKFGAASMFDKPFEIEDLLAKIREILVLDSPEGHNWTPGIVGERSGTEIPVDIVFSHYKAPKYISRSIREAASILAPIREQLLYCRVVIVGPGNPDHSGRFHIQVMATLPDKVFVVRSNQIIITDDEGMNAAIPVAFEATLGKILKYLENRK